MSVLTFARVRVRNWVAPIQAFKVPNGCSTACRRTFIASGIRSSRPCVASRTLSYTQRFPAKHSDVLEQSLPYRVPLNLYSAVATFNGSVFPDRTRGRSALSVRAKPRTC
ncbi:hypothetical protein SAMN05192568_103339 [Methylobacterium pseudosasicola]|uniref:Uncharacterized protein n=1 Tax=Methylobacterium pseudosasicola TaxID=582667 RepID=A0A1I4R5Z0_9HYPH|nr:hypothetical protein SAMN05192568_103339 [Methylobacterium pseudosasicola]